MTDLLLNVSNVERQSRVNGPGVRAVVWVQGCTIGCPGCFNRHTHAHEAKRLLDPHELGQQLCVDDNIDGLTISGGEPFEQAHACSILARTVQELGKTVMVFSGYRHDILKASTDAYVQKFLDRIDLLVAGPYVETLPTDGSLWRGSANQRLHFLTERLRVPEETEGDLQPCVELKVAGSGIAMTGFPQRQDLDWIGRVAQASPVNR